MIDVKLLGSLIENSMTSSNNAHCVRKRPVGSGFDLTIINPESEGAHSDAEWEHIGLEVNAVRGFQSRTFSQKVLEYFESMELDFDAYIIDWQVGVKVGEALAEQNQPCFLMDRSPPADTGILAKLQWKVWKNAWKLVKSGLFTSGFVVSNAHLRFVSQSLNIPATDIVVLEAGVTMRDDSLPRSRQDGEAWKFVYHGQLDKHRGIIDFMEHIVAWNEVGIPCHLTLIGEVHCFCHQKETDKTSDFFTLRGRMPQQNVLEHLREYHFGILPMPAN